MFNKLAVILSIVSINFAHANEASDWLKKADSFRLSSESAKIDIDIELYKNDVLEEVRPYRVYIKSNRMSLVVFKNPSEIGQKVLMNGDQYHLFLPNTLRAIRISPMQKLLGEASTGDISTMTWHEDYNIVSSQQHVIMENQDCVQLELKGKRDGLTYDQVILYLNSTTHAPVYSKLYLASGKLAKEAIYKFGDNKKIVTKMFLIDRIQTGRKTLVNYKNITASDVPDKIFNPQYLTRNQVE